MVEAVIGAYLGVESVDFEGKYLRKNTGKSWMQYFSNKLPRLVNVGRNK